MGANNSSGSALPYPPSWLGEGASFAMCTDAAAVTQLASAVSYKYPLDLARPPEEHAASLMLRVTAPEFQGDGHTKWLLQHPETYAVRRVLAEQLIRSFFGVLWNEFHPLRSKVKLHVMAGPHAERALVKVHGSHWCWAEQGLAPAMPAKTKLGSVFLYNVEAVTLRRSALVAFFSTQVTPVVEPGEMMTRMSALGDTWQLTSDGLWKQLRLKPHGPAGTTILHAAAPPKRGAAHQFGTTLPCR